MKRFAIGILALLGVVSITASASAQRVALHVTNVTSKICAANKPTITCDNYVLTGTAGDGTVAGATAYTVYLTAVVDTIGTTIIGNGFKGVSFGIGFEPYMDNGGGSVSGLTVSTWTRCTDGTEFVNGAWPGNGGEAVVTWTTCQMDAGPGTNVQSVAGAFQILSYTASYFRVKNRTVDNKIEIADCGPQGGTAHLVPETSAAFVWFADAGQQGCNPCVTPLECMIVATEPTTWGKLKNTFGGE